VVLAVGARLSGQASSVDAGVEVDVGFVGQRRGFGLPVMAISLPPWRLTSGTMVSSSSLSPEFDNRDQHVVAGDHAEVAMHGLGRMHEVGRRAGAGQVAAILRAMCPDLPMPLTMTRPRQARIIDTAALKARPVDRPSAATAVASMRNSTWRQATRDRPSACRSAGMAWFMNRGDYDGAKL
jgi:hypothetical protein